MQKKLFSLLGILTLAFTSEAQISKEKLDINFKQSLEKEQFLSPENVQYVVSSEYTTNHNGLTHVYCNQLVNGLEVFNLNADIHLNKDGKIVAYHHNFIANASKFANSNSSKLSKVEALNKALNSVGIVSTQMQTKTSQLENGKDVWFEPSLSSEKMMVKRGYIAVANQIKLVYQVEFLLDETNDWWNKKVDANTGEILEELSYTTHCNFENSSKNQHGSFVFESEVAPVILGKKASSGTYNVFPLPLESPARGQRSLMENMATANGSPYGWHDTNGVAGPEFKITRGNNVFAKEDTLNLNSATIGFSPNGGDSLIFDYEYNVDNKPRNNLNAAIVNIFYWNNIIHDIFNNYGFDEKGGNYQQKNYSGLGLGRDAVMADAMDGSGKSNANFSAPADGSSGRMQMFLWPTSGAASNNNILGVSYPSSVKGKFYGVQSVAGPRLNAARLPGRVILLRDSLIGQSATTNTGCGLIANSNEFAGNIVLIDRGGSCGTQSSVSRTKIKAIQAAGAIAVIIAYNTNGFTPTAVTGTDNAITIPSISIGYGTGVMLKNALASDSVYVTLFDSTEFNPARVYDSDFDNGVIAHEYGHGISIRLTGGPSNSSCLGNQEQGGEGWSDFFGLALTTRVWEKSATASRGIGTFVIDEDTNGVGIRNYRYSRNMAINPVTYNSIKLSSFTVPHGVGSVWCSMLYDIYWDMIDQYGFDPDWYNGKGGNNKTMQLVIDGLKLQKCNPGFADARDAILLADSINNGGANKSLLWKAFARRGLGFSANQGTSASRSDGTQAFDLPTSVTGLAGIDQFTNFNVYPNPAQSIVTVDVFGGASITGVEIYDLNGQLVQTYKNTNLMLPSATLNIQQHCSGYYLLKITSTEGIAYKKLLLN
ncbi:MAG: M36 family metallopeptidase [bacterium]|nr:M36 family metallopeptidase [bacterium]